MDKEKKHDIKKFNRIAQEHGVEYAINAVLNQEHIEQETSSENPLNVNLNLQMPESSESDSLSPKSVVQSIANHARFILIMYIIFSMLGASAAFLYTHLARTHTGVATAIIMFGFPEADEGLDPHGLPLNVNMLQSPYVIGQALDYLGLRERGISAEDVRHGFSIRGVVPHDVLDEIMLIREHATRLPERLIYLEPVVYHPTKFVLQLERRGSLAGLRDQDMTDLLDQIVAQYVAYFVRTYNEFQFMDVIVGHFDPSLYDYFEIVRVLDGTVGNMLSYVDSMRYVAPDFRSPTTQMTFGDIRANLSLVRTVDINHVSALITINNMSRNRERSARILEHNIARMEIEMAVARAGAELSLYLANEVYLHEQWVFPYMWQPGDFQRGDLQGYIHRRDTTRIYEDLLRDVLRYSGTVSQLEENIAFYQIRLEGLRSSTNPANPGDVQFVQENIPRLFAALQDWENIVNQTVEDYLLMELYREAVRVLAPAYFSNSLAAYLQLMVMIVIGAGFAGIIISILIALYRGPGTNKPQKVKSVNPQSKFYREINAGN